MPPRRCISCSTLTVGTRCPTCSRAKDRERNASRPHYRGGYQAKRAHLVAMWHDLGADCWLCGEPLHPELVWPDPMSTTADHVVPGDPGSELRPAHGLCNSARGNRDSA
jgi:hypothetical protein